MQDHGQPVLVYDRVGRNRRNTAILLSLVPVLLLPFTGGIVVYVVPWILVFGTPMLILSGLLPMSELREHPVRYEVVTMAVAGALVLAGMTVAILLVMRFYRTRLLQTMGTPLTREAAPDLWRTVENLCIGAGLPMPRLYLIDSPVPNAFATGADPEHASLGVTRGLVELLQERELEGVVAHELSHIGNHDTQLTTAVAAVTATLRIPIGIVTGIYRGLTTLHIAAGILFIVGVIYILGMVTALTLESIAYLQDELTVPRWMVWRQIFVATVHWHVFLFAPAIGLFIRQAISRQREFLADADAVVLTRDPEGLALALAKIDAWTGPRRFNLGPSAAHLCIANPLPTDTPWWDRIFPCHPPMQDRIGLLARMGSGISESALQTAAQEAVAAGRRATIAPQPPPVLVDASQPALPDAPAGAGDDVPNGTPLYEAPDGWSKVLGSLPEGTVVTISETNTNFLRVTTADGRQGYVSRAARSHLITEAPHG